MSRLQELPRFPGITIQIKHFTIGVGLATVLLLQMQILDATAPSVLAEDTVMVRTAGASFVVYSMLPQVRWAGSAALQLVGEQLRRGESA
jgi:hypothetical protein